MNWNAVLVCVACLLLSCGDGSPVYHATDNPLRLSDWNLFRIHDGVVVPNADTLLFSPRNTLFSDYAHKMRTLWMPDGSRASWQEGRLDYPVGTVLTKTFHYPRQADGRFLQVDDAGGESSLAIGQNRLLETRLLVRRGGGWEALPYVWNDAQTEAFLRVAGTSIPAELLNETGSREFTYFVPNQNQCSGCHTRVHPDGGLEPLGAVAAQLNHEVPGSASSAMTVLAAMLERGWLESPPAEPVSVPDWRDESETLSQRAAAYLDINCGHCHNPDGAADTSALLLDGFARTAAQMGLCKPPVAAGGGAGNRLYGIVPGHPDQSILLYRLQSSEPDEMMPELGRSLVHKEGVDLIRQWIASLPGTCD